MYFTVSSEDNTLTIHYTDDLEQLKMQLDNLFFQNEKYYKIINNNKLFSFDINQYNKIYLNINPNTLLVSGYNIYNSIHDGDSGLDLYCPDELIIPPKSTFKIDFKIKCEANTSYWLIPRSSISKTPLRMANSIGLIDKGYRGNIMAVVDNISNENYVIKKNDRLFQICFPDLRKIKPIMVDNLSETDRGEGGFGSTGK